MTTLFSTRKIVICPGISLGPFLNQKDSDIFHMDRSIYRAVNCSNSMESSVLGRNFKVDGGKMKFNQ
jgi:hypothetical protein